MKPIYDLDLTVRTANMLRVAGYETLEQLESDSLPIIESKLISKYGRTVRRAMLEIKDLLIPEYPVGELVFNSKTCTLKERLTLSSH